jgi:hypothetical protein
VKLGKLLTATTTPVVQKCPFLRTSLWLRLCQAYPAEVMELSEFYIEMAPREDLKQIQRDLARCA